MEVELNPERLQLLGQISNNAREVATNLLNLQVGTKDLVLPQLFRDVVHPNLALFGRLGQLLNDKEAPRDIVPSLGDIFRDAKVKIVVGEAPNLLLHSDKSISIVLTKDASTQPRVELISTCVQYFLIGSFCAPRGNYESIAEIPKIPLGEARIDEFKDKKSANLVGIGLVWFESFAGMRSVNGELKK